MKKRILCLLLALVMVLGMFPVSAMAASGNSVTAYLTAVDCVNGKIVYTRKALTVTPGLAKKAADEAIGALSMMQATDGSFASIDGTSSESVAQIVAALSALGIDADADSRFIKSGVSALDALCAFFVEGGGFKHIPNGKLDGMATEQSYYALAAYFRMLDGKTALFNMTDVIDMGGDKVEEEPTETLPVETEPAATEPTVNEEDNKGGFPWWLVVVIVVLAGAIVVLVIIPKPKKRSKVR